MGWSMRRIRSLVEAVDWERVPSSDEWIPVDGLGWYGLKHKAYDLGDTGLVDDCVTLERAVDSIRDPLVRSAIILRMLLYNPLVIGVKARKLAGRPNDPRPVSALLSEGYKTMYRFLNEEAV